MRKLREWFSYDKHLPKVAGALLRDPAGRHSALDVAESAGVRAGVAFILLHRLLDAGWVTDGWETPSEARDPRHPRRWYVLTGEGAAMLSDIAAVSR